MAKFGSVVFPTGLAGNHLRWLLFLDRQFPNPWGETDLDAKLHFIENRVYGTDRTWNHWLHIEWKFRTQLDSTLEIRHDCWDWENKPTTKELYLSSSDWQKPFLHYYHINLGLNSCTPESAIKQIAQWIEEFESIEKNIHSYPAKKIIKCDALFEPTLDRDFYQEVIDFYGFDDNYHAAQQVHGLYYHVRKKSMKDFYTYFTSDHFNSMLEQINHDMEFEKQE